jgi:peptide deformylase
MVTDSVLLLGDPRLRAVCAPVEDPLSPAFSDESRRLKAALDAFRAAHGFGRGIAAPQIGISRRFVAINFGRGTSCLINPSIAWRSPETFTMWDDCMSF